MIVPNNKCTGCGSCAAACPFRCIEMQSDREGFRQPVIDMVKCVDCHRCEAACPLINKRPENEMPAAYAVKNRDDSIRAGSSSGGVFSALAHRIIADGGAVCAAVYDEDFSVVHRIAYSMEELDRFRGAKYVQSIAEHCFPEIRELLKSGRQILFVGTPCQCAGLHAYLGNTSPNLVLVDMICHGVPSPAVWKSYLAERRRMDADGDALCEINLRDKHTGWSKYAYSVLMRYGNGSAYMVPQGEDWYMRGFTGNLFLRRSCEDCGFKGIHRCTDFTLGDYWGIWDAYPKFDDNKGISLVWIHSGLGRKLWSRICGELDYIPTSIGESIRENTSAVQSAVPHLNRAVFFAGMERGENVISLIQACLNPPATQGSPIRTIVSKIRRRISTFMKR